MIIKRVLGALAFGIVYNFLLFYIGWNGWIWLNTSFGFENQMIYWTIIFGLSYSYILAKFNRFFAFIRVIGSCWMGVIQYGLILLPISNLVVFLLSFTNVSKEESIFWVGTSTLIVFLMICIRGTYNAYSPIVRKYEIEVPKSGNKYKELNISMASDMHFGIVSGKRHAQRLVKMVNELKPDIVLFPGDIIDDYVTPFIEKNMGDVMKEIKSPLGTFGVLGNHEYYGGEVPKFLEEMKRIDLKMLLDESIKLDDSFYLVGRRDYTEKNRKTIEELIKDLDKELPIILLDHQPHQLKEAASNGVDISLSGHTHRGQMIPNHLITKRVFELDWGYLKKEQLHAFVSSGYGFWGPPLRTGSRSEIIQIKVTFMN